MEEIRILANEKHFTVVHRIMWELVYEYWLLWMSSFVTAPLIEVKRIDEKWLSWKRKKIKIEHRPDEIIYIYWILVNELITSFLSVLFNVIKWDAHRTPLDRPSVIS